MAKFARWCIVHRRAVLAVWLLALTGFFGVSQLTGSAYSNSYSLSGTDSAKAQQALTRDFPAQAGDSDQIVVQARHGTLRSPATETAVTSMLARVARLPDVRSVTSPYGPGGQISRDGTIGLAPVNLSVQATKVPNSAVTRLISTARSADRSLLNDQLGGAAIENVAPGGGVSTSVVLGIVLALVVLFFAFRRSVFGALLPLISALVAIGAGFSIVELLTHAVAIASWVPTVAILVSLGVGVDYALFVVSRHRNGLLAGQTSEDAAVTALNTSGRAVLLAGLTVCAAMLGLFALPDPSLYGVAVTVSLVVGLTMVASLTLLPAMLGFLGPKVLRPAERTMLAQQGRPVEQTGTFWQRWAEGLGRGPLIPGLVALAVIAILAIPALSMRVGLLDATSTDPPSFTSYQAYQLLAKGFGPGFNGPLVLVGQVDSPADRARFAAFTASARSEPGVAGIVSPQVSPNGKAEVAQVIPTTGPQDAATITLLDRLRAGVPRAEAGSTLAIHIGGTTAANEDYSQVTNAALPQFVAIVVGVAFLLLLVVFRSLLIPLVASIMNLLSFGVALGVMTAAFQFGWGKPVLGFGQSGPIEAWIPALMFAVLFGLSTDYEVFLVSRMHEEWTLTRDNKRAVIRGQAETGRVITAASLIMILVFASFIIGGQMPIQQVGLGMAAAIFVDAYLIRTVLVPALMHMLGRANWWVPAWLDRLLPRLHVQPAELTSAGLLGQPTDVRPLSGVGPREQ
jgi:RND superfamily putative drug exporter